VAARLIFLFVLLPLAELCLLLKFAQLTSPGWTMLLVVVTGLVGYWLARSQGLRTYHRIQSDLAAGQMPTDALLDGMMIFLAGAFLLTPGILTDLAGFSLLVPLSRSYYRRLILGWVKSRFSWQQVGGGQFNASVFSQGDRDSAEVVDVDVPGNTVDAEVMQRLEHDETDPGAAD